MKLLIVDDSNIIRGKISRCLSGRTYEVVGLARNGVEALQMFKHKQPEIVTMDLTMPQMDGIRCVREIMKIAPQTRILVISALSDKATAIQALKEGARGFLCKPFADEELRDAMSELIDGD